MTEKKGERERCSNNVMKFYLILYLFTLFLIPHPVSPSPLLVILMKRPQMTPFSVKLIEFGAIQFHFLLGYFCLFSQYVGSV